MRIFSCTILALILGANLHAQNVFSVKGNKTLLNDIEFKSIGLRCSNALLSDDSVTDLVSHLDEYRDYGLNTISVFFMGSRYSNIHGYNLDGTLNATYASRMGKIIEACDKRKMVVLVGILYWGSGMHSRTNEYYREWKQSDVNAAMRNTIAWLGANKYRNVFIDPDNEGMAEIGAKFNIAEMICEGKKSNAGISIAYNGAALPPPCADLGVHFAFKSRELPYIQTEGTPDDYWGTYSKVEGKVGYINVGIYTEEKKARQLRDTKALLDQGHGYLFASTWLQNVPPHYDIGGDGTAAAPGMKWWMDFIKANYKKVAN